MIEALFGGNNIMDELQRAIRNGASSSSEPKQRILEMPIYGTDGKLSVDDLLEPPKIYIIDENWRPYKPEDVVQTLLYYSDDKGVIDKDVSVEVLASNKSEQPEAERKNEISRLDDGIENGAKRTGLSWKYMMKNLQKHMTKDESKRKEIENDMQRISEEYGALPDEKGMAQVGSIGMNVLGVGLPTVLSGALGSPITGAVVGGGLAALDMGKTAAQANMDIDNYEKSTGVKVSESDRNAYTLANVATDAIMNVLLGSKALGGFSPALKKKVSGDITKAIMKNPVAQHEFNTMTRQVLKNEARKLPGEIAKESAKSGVTAGVTSGAMEAEKSIYTHETPELNKIVSSAVGGALSGMASGAVGGAFTPKFTHQRRYNQDDIYYVSDMRKTNGKGLKISEINPEQVRTDGNKEYVKGRVTPSTGGATIEGEYDARNIVKGSYKEADKEGATRDGMDGWSMPTERMQEYNDKWDSVSGKKGSDEYYQIRNEVVQGMAADLGVPITVYPSLKDVPSDLLKQGVVRKSGAVTVNGERIYVVLDQCDNLNASNMNSILRHEAAGHFGLPKLYRSDEEFEQELNKAGRKAYGEVGDYEERIALQAERRDQYQGPVKEERKADVYDMLRRSEDYLRNSTTNELRNSDMGRKLDKRFQDGKPMPSSVELEQFYKIVEHLNKQHK